MDFISLTLSTTYNFYQFLFVLGLLLLLATRFTRFTLTLALVSSSALVVSLLQFLFIFLLPGSVSHPHPLKQALSFIYTDPFFLLTHLPYYHSL